MLFCKCDVEVLVGGLLVDRFEPGLLGKLEVIVEGLLSSLPRDAVGGLNLLVGEVDGEGDHEQVFSRIGNRGNGDVPDVEAAVGGNDARHLVESLGAGFVGEVHEREEGGNRIEGVIKELEAGGIHYQF